MPAKGENIDIIYDRYGNPVMRLMNDNYFYSFEGVALGFMHSNNAIYTLTGLHVGRYENGILRDLSGNTAGFGESPTGKHPILPYKQYVPYSFPIERIDSKYTIGKTHNKKYEPYGWSQYLPLDIITDKKNG